MASLDDIDINVEVRFVATIASVGVSAVVIVDDSRKTLWPFVARVDETPLSWLAWPMAVAKVHVPLVLRFRVVILGLTEASVFSWLVMWRYFAAAATCLDIDALCNGDSSELVWPDAGDISLWFSYALLGARQHGGEIGPLEEPVR